MIHKCYKVRFCPVQIGHINQLVTYLMLLIQNLKSSQPIPNKTGRITVVAVSVVVAVIFVVIVTVVVAVEIADI